MPKVNGLSHIVLHCRDLDTMIAFYRDVLGLTVNQGQRDPERLVFLTANPESDDHEIALMPGRDGDSKIINHIAFRVDSPQEVKAYYDEFRRTGVPIDHTVSHAYVEQGNTVSCYFLDPEGNRLEVYALVTERDQQNLVNRPLDLNRDLDDIVGQASGFARAAAR
jgi:catechol 2,3-dioxygenase-like lactoylglutathione lyase family enzyme